MAYLESKVRGMWDVRCEGWGVWFGLDGPQKERDDACMARGLWVDADAEIFDVCPAMSTYYLPWLLHL